MFGNVKKFVQKASKKHLGGGAGVVQGLRQEDVHPRLAFHNGVPSGSSSLAYDPTQRILAIATNDGRIKLFGTDNTQALLQSEAAAPSKFLQFFENQGILLSVTIQNHIEVWDIEKKEVCCVHVFKEEITSFAIMQHSSYMFVGDRLGNISVLKLDRDLHNLIQMQYKIPFTESHGTTTEVADDAAVVYTLPQPMAETKRVLIIFRDGVISLWGISESKVVFITGGNTQHSSHNEPKKIASACWACSFGSKVVIGYSNGEIFLWSVPAFVDHKNVPLENKKELHATSNIPLLKLNLGFKMEKVPVVSLRWAPGDGRASRLYVNGFSDVGSFQSFQVIILNENTESRIIKLLLPLTEACLAMEIISCFSESNKHEQSALILLLKSGRFCLYEESQIEHYLLQSQSKSPPAVPKQLMVKLPFGNASITAAKLCSCSSDPSSTTDEDYFLLANKYPYLLSIDSKEKDGSHLPRFSGFANIRNLYITGHHDGSVNFWDASCPLFLLILSIKQQGEDGGSSNGIPVTALHFDICSKTLISGDQSGLVRIIEFKKDQSSSENIFSFLQAKKGSNYNIRNIKLNGAIVMININATSKHLAIGTDRGYVSVVDMEGTNTLYQKHFSSQLYTGIISLQFEKCIQNGFEKNVLMVGLEDSSVLALEEDTGNALSISSVHTKKPSRALYMKILDESFKGASMPDFLDVSNEHSIKDAVSKQSVLLVCSEKDVRLYSLGHAIQGIKKLCGKKKLNGTCFAASVVISPSSEAGLILVFASGKIEIRSLPDLSLLKQASLRGFAFSTLKPNADGAICFSSEGEIVVVNGDQEICFVSVLVRDIYRHLEYISQVYKKDVTPQQGNSSMMIDHQEKKKGIFSMVVKDLKGNKPKNSLQIDAENPHTSSSEELSAIFSTANFLLDEENRHSSVHNEDVELEIDDIDLEDTKEKPKGRNISLLNKQKLGKKLQAIKGKLKSKMDEQVNSGKPEHDNGKVVGAVDQIKKKYGYTMNQESSIPKLAESKLSENIRKLQSIGLRTSEMQDTAQSFSSMARELLQTAQGRKSS